MAKAYATCTQDTKNTSKIQAVIYKKTGTHSIHWVSLMVKMIQTRTSYKLIEKAIT